MRLAIMVGLICAAMVTVAVGESLADDFEIQTLPWVMEWQDALYQARELQDKAFDAQEQADKALVYAQELGAESKKKTARFLKLRERVEVGFKSNNKTVKGLASDPVEQTLDMYKYAYRNAQPYVKDAKKLTEQGIEYMIPVSEYVVEKGSNGIATALDFVTPHAKAAAETGSEKAQQGISWIRNKTGW
jgi:hypothetical protein